MASRVAPARTSAGIVIVFGLSRLGAYAAGMRFDPSPLVTFWHFPDRALLRGHLFQTLFYMHDQPPLFGLVVGTVLKFFPHAFATVMHGIYIALGLIATLALYALLRQFGFSDRGSALVAVGFTLLPATMVYEQWLFYEYPTMTLLLCAAVALHRFVSRNSRVAGLTFFTLMAAVIYMRSAFQVIWLLGVIALLLAVSKRRRLGLSCCAVPLLAVALLYAKNEILFGVPTTSSWMGMNLARTTTNWLAPSEKATLVRQGKLHPVSLIEPFSPLARYASIVPTAKPTGIAVLDTSIKTGGRTNYNNKTYIAIADAYLRDSLWVIRHRPDAYAASVRRAVTTSMRPASDYKFVGPNRYKIKFYALLVDSVVNIRTHLGGIGYGILATYLFAAAYLTFLVGGLIRRTRKPDATTATLLFIGLTVTYAYTVSSLTEVGENQRMRFFLDPLVIAVAAHGVHALALRARELPRLLVEHAPAELLQVDVATAQDAHHL